MKEGSEKGNQKFVKSPKPRILPAPQTAKSNRLKINVEIKIEKKM